MQRRTRPFPSVLIVLLLAIATLTACGSGQQDSDEPKLKEDGKLVVAMSGEFQPFSYWEGEQLTGFDHDIAKAIADELGLELVPKTAGFSTLVQGTQDGRYDMLVASTTATKDRAKVVDFANGYYTSGPQYFVAKGAECKPLDAGKDLGNPKVGVASGTTYEKYLRDEQVTDEVQVYESDITALQDAATKRLDGALTDQLVGQFQIEQAGLDLEPCGEPLYTETQAPAVAKGNPLRQKVSEALDAIIDDGRYAEISTKYFGEDIADRIDNKPVDEVMSSAQEDGPPSFGQMFVDYLPTLLKAAWLTLAITFVALVLAVVLGSLVAWMHLSSVPPLRWLAIGFIGLIRGTPLIAQIFVLYFGLVGIVELSGFWAGAIALAVHNSAYIAEIVRSGFLSVPKGLVEASRSLGMSKLQALRRVQVPLATRTILPVLGSQFIIAVKDSSLVAFIGMGELFRTAQNMAAAEYSPLNAYLIVSIYYLVIVLVLTGLVGMLERRMNPDRKEATA
ncbi:ABC transporter substrate-binding protein/permease [uncultured Tessaracoccus sp.]|uniref:ABC transporter substrate-binding protein/permease n=1 Tax=uncultured Tessaracoccus sp. TaxID=905023 RepID=UPI0025FEDA36|nr:ABC transporter substrate-binding protein/permease [uncultured Tessaracoccus sp.]